MKYRLIIWVMLVVLTGCSHSAQINRSIVAEQTIPQQLQPIVIDRLSVESSIAPVREEEHKVENTTYKKIVAQYTENMNEVISTMSETIDREQAVTNYVKVKANIKRYEQAKETAKVSAPPVVEENISHANEQYLSSLDDIVQGIEMKDEALKKDGFNAFTETHQLLNAITYEIAAPAASEEPMTEEPTSEIPVVTEIYTAEEPTTETP